MDLNKEKLIEMDLIVAHKIIQQIEKREKREKMNKQNIVEYKKSKIEKTYSKSCEFCGQNVIWCICKNDLLN